MTFVTTQPEMLMAAASQLTSIGSELSAQNAAAAASTMAVVPAAVDEVSVLAAAQFGFHATLYQAVSSQAEAIHDLFVRILGLSAGSYATTDAANAISET
jgi:PE family